MVIKVGWRCHQHHLKTMVGEDGDDITITSRKELGRMVKLVMPSPGEQYKLSRPVMRFHHHTSHLKSLI